MIFRTLLLIAVIAGVLAGCAKEETMDPSAGKGEVKPGAGEAKTPPAPNESGP